MPQIYINYIGKHIIQTTANYINIIEHRKMKGK